MIQNFYDFLNVCLTVEGLMKYFVFIHMPVDTWSGPSCAGEDCPWEELCHGYA